MRFGEQRPRVGLDRGTDRAAEIIAERAARAKGPIMRRTPKESAQNAPRFVCVVCFGMAASDALVLREALLSREPKRVRNNSQAFKRDLLERCFTRDLADVVLGGQKLSFGDAEFPNASISFSQQDGSNRVLSPPTRFTRPGNVGHRIQLLGNFIKRQFVLDVPFVDQSHDLSRVLVDDDATAGAPAFCHLSGDGLAGVPQRKRASNECCQKHAFKCGANMLRIHGDLHFIQHRPGVKQGSPLLFVDRVDPVFDKDATNSFLDDGLIDKLQCEIDLPKEAVGCEQQQDVDLLAGHDSTELIQASTLVFVTADTKVEEDVFSGNKNLVCDRVLEEFTNLVDRAILKDCREADVDCSN